ncbi:hypothetical protein [Agrococcus sp. Marseille-P2731]|uniref:hypothetical protein n=1 Tax=Agrococcus sp. Marseille-P2731 TaxID=1841862 RepID=UPI001160897B|nr:hypothetical protein [Agrococcus sp. Marseille-P2731]
MSLVISLVLLGLGIGQRTIWAPPETIVAQLEQPTDAQLLYLSGETMNQHDGRQTVSISGSGAVTVAVGRDHDVLGWIGESQHAVAELGESEELVLAEEAGDSEALPTIAGSDLWIEEYAGDGEVRFEIDLPVGFAMLVQGEPGAAAPADVRVEWPFDAKTPLFGPLMTAGFVFLALALVLFLLALGRHRRRRGPQRRSHRELTRAERRQLQRDAREGLPLPERGVTAAPERDALEAPDVSAEPAASPPEGASTDRTDADGAPEGDAAVGDGEDAAKRTGEGKAEHRAARTRRRFGIVAFPLLASIALTGCGPQYWPSPEPSETAATPTPSTLEEALPQVALTENQFERVLDETREVVAAADTELSAETAARRVAGPALAARTTNYEVRSQNDELPALQGIADGEVQLLLPQQTEVWPRTAMAVVAWEDGAQAQSALVFQQADARSDYRLIYQMTLASGVQLPAVASPTIGAASLPLDTPLLVRRPSEITFAYADMLINGDDSSYASWFRQEGDALREQFGRDWKDEQRELPEYELTNLEWSWDDDEQPPLMLVANDGGALVATSFNETQRTTPNEEGVEISTADGAGILAGVEASETGIDTTYQLQVLFAVPPADAPEGAEIQIVGYAQTLLDASEVPG